MDRTGFYVNSKDMLEEIIMGNIKGYCECGYSVEPRAYPQFGCASRFGALLFVETMTQCYA